MIGNNIKQIRLSKQLTQSELAEKLGISNKTVCSWEINRTEPKMGMVEKIAYVLGCTKTDLIYGTDYEPAGSIEPKQATFGSIASNLTGDESEALSLYRRLDPEDQGRVKERMETMLEADKYKKRYCCRNGIIYLT